MTMNSNTSSLTALRVRASRAKQWVQTGLLPRLGTTKSVRYLGWDVAAESMDETVAKHLDHPTKAIMLDWLAADPLLPERFSLLDIGCGPGVLAAMIARHPQLKTRVRYTGLDQSAPALEYCRASYGSGFEFLNLDLQTQSLPGHYDAVVISEVVEHLPHYKPFITAALALRPRVFALTTFGAIPGLRRDRLRWNAGHQAYMNSYSFAQLHEFLRAQTGQLYVADLGTQEFTRYWFPRKTLAVFYLRLAEARVTWTPDGWKKE